MIDRLSYGVIPYSVTGIDNVNPEVRKLMDCG